MIKTIADVCRKVYSGGTPSRKHQEYFEQGTIPWLNTGEIAFNRIYKTENFITEAGLSNSSAKWVPANAVIVAMYGATAARTAIAKIPLTTNQACCNLIVDEEIADYRYVYYYICSQYTKLASLANGGAQQNLNAGQIKEYPIVLPDLLTQKRIADILSAIDDKIENNARINDNLQQQADAIFAELFLSGVDRSVLTVADVSIKVTDGVHNTVKDDPSGEYYLLSCKNIKGGLLSIGDSERRISKETFEKLRKRTRLEKGDILLSSVGTVGELLLLKELPSNYEFQRSVAMIKPNPTFVSSEYLYQALRSKKNEIIHAAHGAVQQCLFISDISDFQIPVPTKSELEKFDSLVVPMFSKIQSNESENKRLVALRDILLPKLMAGEVDVSSIRI